MKVKRLIQALQKCDPNMEVIVDGYEEGYEKVGSVKKLNVKEFELPGRAWFYGIYERSRKGKTVVYLTPKDHPVGWSDD